MKDSHIQKISDQEALQEYPNNNCRETFRQTIYRYYAEKGRAFPWRNTADPYRILVSEIMLQQTQVERVLGKYEPFLSKFPDFETLAASELYSVLSAWQGLGYNRRAVALKETAQRVMAEYSGSLPQGIDRLMALPGIGRSTAGAVLAFAYGIPEVFIETNIRRVFIHFFFSDQEKVRDREIIKLVEETLDRDNPRHWYYALMDFGSMLKEKLPNPNRKSAHYTRQAPFEGSNRQIRGRILKELIARGPVKKKDLITVIGKDPERINGIIDDLTRQGFLRQAGQMIAIA